MNAIKIVNTKAFALIRDAAGEVIYEIDNVVDVAGEFACKRGVLIDHKAGRYYEFHRYSTGVTLMTKVFRGGCPYMRRSTNATITSVILQNVGA